MGVQQGFGFVCRERGRVLAALSEAEHRDLVEAMARIIVTVWEAKKKKEEPDAG